MKKTALALLALSLTLLNACNRQPSLEEQSAVQMGGPVIDEELLDRLGEPQEAEEQEPPQEPEPENPNQPEETKPEIDLEALPSVPLTASTPGM